MSAAKTATLERRERILAAARELISELPYAEITVRELARRCRVSVPTLYNQFGGKDALLGAAVESHFREALHELIPTDRPPGAARVLELVRRLAQRTIVLAPYHQSVLRAFVQAARETAPLQKSIAADLREVFAVELRGMREAGELVDWIEPDVTAIHLATACIQATAVWGQRLVGDDGLAAFLEHVSALLLLGVSQGAGREELEATARRAQTSLGRELEAAAVAAAARQAAAG